MENLEKNLTPEQSLAIITKSLEQSRKDMIRNAGWPMLLWGFLVLATSLLVFVLWSKTDNPTWNCLWFIMPVIGYLSAWRLGKKKDKGVRSFLSDTIERVWLAFGILSISTPTLTIVLLNIINWCTPDAVFNIYNIPGGIPITLIIVALLGLATAITGLVLKNGWIGAAGIICGTVGVAFSLVARGPYEALLLTGIAVIGLIIPGFIINAQTKNNE